MRRIHLQTTEGVFEAILDDTPIAAALIQHLPFSTTANRWGDEIYCDVPFRMANTKPTRTVKVGDITYWPQGPSLCVFFGPTPASQDEQPRPASDVTVVGYTDAPPARLRAVAEKTTIVIRSAAA